MSSSAPIPPRRLSVAGMMCGHCEKSVREALEAVPGVASASVDLGSGRATVALAEPVGDLLAFVPSPDASATLGALFAAGLLTSLHCAGMCGAMALGGTLRARREDLTQRAQRTQSSWFAIPGVREGPDALLVPAAALDAARPAFSRWAGPRH